MTTIGSLFTGYGGIDMGVAMAVDPDALAVGTLIQATRTEERS